MRIQVSWLRPQIRGCQVLFMAASFFATSAWPQEVAPPGQEAYPPVQSQNSDHGAKPENTNASQTEKLPNSPGSVRFQSVDDDRTVTRLEPSPKPQSDDDPPRPVGTAAAPTLITTGVAASRPSGAAIAPRRQRRARSFLIKVGAIVGAGVAVGTVVALSSGSPSRPPGSH